MINIGTTYVRTILIYTWVTDESKKHLKRGVGGRKKGLIGRSEVRRGKKNGTSRKRQRDRHGERIPIKTKEEEGKKILCPTNRIDCSLYCVVSSSLLLPQLGLAFRLPFCLCVLCICCLLVADVFALSFCSCFDFFLFCSWLLWLMKKRWGHLISLSCFENLQTAIFWLCLSHHLI